MLGENESIFDGIPYSLPSNTHSLGVATRTPTAGYSQSSMFMPDYGGILEVPDGHFKNNGFERMHLPFFPKPHYVRAVDIQEKMLKPKCAQCLAVVRTPEAGYENRFITIRAISRTLYLDSIETITCLSNGPPETCKFKSYAHVPYSNEITGIKHREQLDDSILVKFDEGIKLLKLNKSYNQAASYSSPGNSGSDDDGEGAVETSQKFPEQTAINFVESFPGKLNHKTTDACLLYHNRNKVGIAASNGVSFQVKLYDIAHSRRLISSINTEFKDQSLLLNNSGIASRTRGRNSYARSFVAAGNSMEHLQQLESDPFHLVNMMVTTSMRTAVVDPRATSLSSTIVDLSQLEARLPTELLKKVEYSLHNDYQIYSMSNIHLKVFDRRYPLTPIISLAHMLDPVQMEAMDLSRISLENYSETLCLSAAGRLSFITFDRSRAYSEMDQLVTPRSVHPPIHEPSPSEITCNKLDELYGLSTATGGIFESGVLFSVIQLSQEGDVCIRGYPHNIGFQDTPIHESQAELIVKQEKRRRRLRQKAGTLYHPELDMRKFDHEEIERDESLEEVVKLDLIEMNCISKAEENLTSQRALKKFQSMKDKLLGK